MRRRLHHRVDEKEQIYLAATKKNDNWISHNNLGAVYMQKALRDRDLDEVAKAETQFDIANRQAGESLFLHQLSRGLLCSR